MKNKLLRMTIALVSALFVVGSISIAWNTSEELNAAARALRSHQRSTDAVLGLNVPPGFVVKGEAPESLRQEIVVRTSALSRNVRNARYHDTIALLWCIPAAVTGIFLGALACGLSLLSTHRQLTFHLAGYCLLLIGILVPVVFDSVWIESYNVLKLSIDLDQWDRGRGVNLRNPIGPGLLVLCIIALALSNRRVRPISVLFGLICCGLFVILILVDSRLTSALNLFSGQFCISWGFPLIVIALALVLAKDVEWLVKMRMAITSRPRLSRTKG